MIFSNPRLLRFKPLFISLIALFAMIAIILSVNYYANHRVDRNANILDGAGEMSDQFYNLALSVQQLNNIEPEARSELVEQTQEVQAEISTLLNLLDQGGRYDYGDGDYIDISALQEPDGRAALQEVQDIWQSYESQLNSIINTDSIYQADEVSEASLETLAGYAFSQQQDIYDFIDEIYADRFDSSQYWSKIAKIVLIGGIIFISLYLLWFVLYFVRRLVESEERLEAAREQNQEILSTINQGLFLIDQDLIIADQYSKQLEEIVLQKNIEGKSLLEVIAPLISSKDLEVAKSFLKQLYSSWVVEDLIEDLNPLKNIKVAMTLDNGKTEIRYLDFGFSRVVEDDEIIRILVTVTDITQSTELNERLDLEQQQNDRQIEMISNLIDVDGATLQEFMVSTRMRIESINDVLKTSGSDSAKISQKARHIYRQIHSLKGEASALKLLPFIDLSQTFEEKIIQITDQREIKGNDFLPLTVHLDELMDLADFVDSLALRLHLYQSETVSNSGAAEVTNASDNLENGGLVRSGSTRNEQSLSISETTELVSGVVDNNKQVQHVSSPQSNPDEQQMDKLTKKWQQFIQDLAQRHNKDIQLQLSGFDTAALDTASLRIINDIVIQLSRNAIVHGIELPNVRRQLGKSSAGQIQLSLREQTQDGIELVLEDDGRGIDFNKIQQKAIDLGLIDAEETKSKSELFNLMFKQGLSTASNVSEDAGRGVGMDIIKALVEENGGKLSVKTTPHQFTRFIIQLPLTEAAA